MKSINYCIYILIYFFISTNLLYSQRPLTQIEGFLEVYDNLDSTSLYIGLESGQLAPASTSPLYLGGTFIGTQAGQNNGFGVYNTFVGYQSGKTNSSNKSNNSFFGAFSGMQNAASSNTFMGYKSGSQNISGSDNSFFGSNAGELHETGSKNTFIGSEAGQASISGRDNTFVGTYSGNGSTTGNFNTFIGSEAGYRNKGGNLNTYLGYYSGESLQDGTSNTLLGTGAGRYISKGDSNIVIGNNAGPSAADSISKKLFIDVERSDAPLIYGEFDNDLIRINGDLDIRDSLSTNHLTVDSNSIAMRFLGEGDDKGISWAEDAGPAFALIYDGLGMSSDNRLHLREYFGSTHANIMTYKGNGHIGIGNEDPMARLHISSGSDATLTSGGYTIMGDKTGTNLVIDDNEIIARDNNNPSTLFLNKESGDVQMGGKIIIQDGSTSAVAGQMRFNTTTSDFEGFDGMEWRSLSNKSPHTIYIGPAAFYSNDNDTDEATSFDNDTGVTGNPSNGNPKSRFLPIQLPVGSTISQITYYYKEDLNDASLTMRLIRFNLNEGFSTEMGFKHETPIPNGPLGWTHADEFDSFTIEHGYFYALEFSSGLTTNVSNTALLFKGAKLIYTLP